MTNNKLILRQIAIVLLLGTVLSFFSLGKMFCATDFDSLTTVSDCFEVDDSAEPDSQDNENVKNEPPHFSFANYTSETDSKTHFVAASATDDVTPSITLSSGTVTILENASSSLTATTQPADLPVTWSSSDTSVATVSDNGVITGVNAGVATVTATMNYLGESYSKNCTVYVTIPNGCYFLKNCASSMYLTASGRFNGDITMVQTSKSTSALNSFDTLKQIFKVRYLGRGCYSVRPLCTPMMLVCAKLGENVEQYESAYVVEDVIKVPKNAQWMITRTSAGLVFNNFKYKTGALQVPENSSVGSAVEYDERSATSNCKWILEEVANPPTGVYLYDLRKNAPAGDVTKRVFVNEVLKPSEIGLKVIVYSPDTIEQDLVWSISNPEICSIYAGGWTVGVVPGNAVVTATARVNRTEIGSISYDIIVVNKVTVNIQALYDGGYVARFPDYNTRLQEALTALKNKYLDDFGIAVNFTVTRFDSYADTTCNPAYNSLCDHAENDECLNSLLYSSGTIVTNEYHHKNLTNNLFRIPLPDTSSLFKIAFLGHDYCINMNGQHCINYGRGVTYTTGGLIGIMNFYSKENEIKTLVHEFGHLYGPSLDHATSYASDLNASLTENFYDDRCIYGRYKNDDSVVENLEICDHCRHLIESNRAKYNQVSEEND